MITWTKDETYKLIILYPNTPNIEIAENLNKTYSSIRNKAKRLRLRKSAEFIRNKEEKSGMLLRENRRYLNNDDLKLIALKYNSRSEFQKEDAGAYVTARMRKILDDICSHMIPLNFSRPQLILFDLVKNLFNVKCIYNDRTAIYPRELDVFIPDYLLAFEYDGERWHRDDDNIKELICINNGITLIKIKENSRRYEEDIKTQLIANLTVINQVTKSNITKDEINNLVISKTVFDSILSKDIISSICNKYDTMKEFRENESRLYAKLCSMGKLEEFTSHMKRLRANWYEVDIKEILKKYTHLRDFCKYENPCYLFITRHRHEFPELYILLNNLIKLS